MRRTKGVVRHVCAYLCLLFLCGCAGRQSTVSSANPFTDALLRCAQADRVLIQADSGSAEYPVYCEITDQDTIQHLAEEAYSWICNGEMFLYDNSILGFTPSQTARFYRENTLIASFGMINHANASDEGAFVAGVGVGSSHQCYVNAAGTAFLDEAWQLGTERSWWEVEW